METSFKAVTYGTKVKVVGPEGGKMMILEAEVAIKLAHDILDKADMAIRKSGEVNEP